MNRSKVDFITSLLSDKKLSTSHKERLYPLILSEIKQAGDVDEQIWQELQEIKKIIQKDQSSHDIEPEDNNTHNPLRTSERLKLFKTGNRLKWITHIFPNSDTEKFDYGTVTTNAIEEYNSIAKDLPNSLRGLIGLFLKQKKSSPNQNTIWYLGDSYKTWWSDEIKAWCSNNEGLHPDTNEELSKKIITPFKKSIEIRDRDDLIAAIKYFLPKNHGYDIFDKIEVDFARLKMSTRFFTGVDQLLSGVSCLFAPIIKRASISHKVSVSSSISEVNDRYVTVVSITHLNSHCDIEFNGQGFISGDLLTAKQKFISLCDWNIVANFSNGTFSIPVLGNAKAEKQQEQAEGFTHQLIFY